MSQELNKDEIKQRLKDANMYEENMSEDQMNEYYKAIKNSETSLIEEKDKSQSPLQEAEKSLTESANELLEAINNSESVAPSNKKRKDTFSQEEDDESLDAFSQDILHRPKSRLKEEEANNNNNNINIEDDKPEKGNEILDIKKTPIGFNDMPKSESLEKNMLRIISHELKFINIQNSKRFLKSDSETRIKMLCNYHIAAAKVKAHFASLSKNLAPQGKPITAIDHDLCVNPVISSLKEEELLLSNNEISYVSRSGRLTKRKVYNEVDESSQDSLSNAKKSRNDDDWMSKNVSSKDKAEKSPKINLKKDSSDKNVNTITMKPSNKVITRSDSPDSSQSDIFVTQATKGDIFDDLKENSPVVSRPRTYQRKHLLNEEIMARSSLFKETPKSGRTATMLNAVKEVTEKNKLQEEKIEKFTNSLELDSQAFEEESEKIIVDDDECFERKRVVPTLPGRRPIHGRKRGGGAGPEPLSISTKKPNLHTTVEEISSSPLVNGASRRTALPRRASSNNVETRGEPSSSTASRGKKEYNNMTPCPLCSVSFPQKDIEAHASTCGEDMFAQTPQPKLSRITCEVCDQVVPLTTEYEVHVKECIAKKSSGNGIH